MEVWRATSIVNPDENRVSRFTIRDSSQIGIHNWAVVVGKVYATAERKTSALGEVFLDANVRLRGL